MKPTAYCLTILSVIAGLISCKSSYITTIETQAPPQLTIPGGVTGVLVVNNAVPQAPDKAIILKYNQKDTNIVQFIQTDTLLLYSVQALAKYISDANYFKQVSICESSLRNDGEWLASMPISPEVCDSLYDESGCNVIISVDRMLTNVVQEITSPTEEYFQADQVFSTIKCISLITSTVYYSEKNSKLTSFSTGDSIAHLNYLLTNDSVDLYCKFPNLIAYEGALNIAGKLSGYFVPQWQSSERIIYTNPGARPTEARRFFDKQKYPQAREIWTELYDNQKNAKNKARMAMNISVSHEMEDDLSSAIEWVEKARSHYKEIDPDKTGKEKAIADRYLSALNARIQNNRILDIQFQ